MPRAAASAVGWVLLWCVVVAKAASAVRCSDELSRGIPPRPAAAPEGSDFARTLAGLSDDAREQAIQQQLLAGNLPQFLRHLTPVRLGSKGDREDLSAPVTVCVSPDYLAVGSDQDFFMVPMRLRTALAVANRFRFGLPTAKIVDAIYVQAPMHLRPQPLPAGDTMRTTAYYWQHSELVRRQRADLDTELGVLTAGDKKDLVLTNRLWSYPDRVAIYGWHRANGVAIQPLSTVHGARYADYSHGVRLVSDTVYAGTRAVSFTKALQSPELARALSSEGQIRNPEQLIQVLSAQAPAPVGHSQVP